MGQVQRAEGDGVDSQMAGYVSVTGSVAEASRAFGVTFGMFKGPDGHMYRSPEQEASAPTAVASSILTDQRARHCPAHDEAGPAAPGRQLLDRKAVLAVLRPEGRH